MSETYRLMRCPYSKILHAYTEAEAAEIRADAERGVSRMCSCCGGPSKLEGIAIMPGEVLAAARNLEGVHQQLMSEIAAAQLPARRRQYTDVRPKR